MTLSRPPTMILTFVPLPSPLLPASAEVLLAASLAQAVSEVRASRPDAASEAYLAVLRMGVHVLVGGGGGEGGCLGALGLGAALCGPDSVLGVRRLPPEDAVLGEGQQALGDECDGREDDHRGVDAGGVEGALRRG